MTDPGPFTPFHKILFATDFSPCSDVVLLYAAALARQFNATLFPTHILSGETLGVDPPVFDQLREAATQQMDDLESSEALAGIRYKPLMAEGNVGQAVSDLAIENEIDLIVLGTHGRTGFKKFIMGSVAEDIFRHAPCPVIAVGPKVWAEARRTVSFKRALYATDFATDAAGKLTLALSLLHSQIEQLTLMHVMPERPIADSDSAKALFRNKLLGMIPIDLLTIAPEIVVEIGPAAETVVQAAADRHADIILLGARAPGLLGSHLMDTAYKIMIEAPCPVLTIAATAHAKVVAA